MSASDRKPFATARRNAKELLKLVKARDLEAIHRAAKHFHHFDLGRFSLMSAQFVIAKELGFKSWVEMLESESAK